MRFTALLHHIYNLDTLRMAYFSLKKEAAPGVDGETWRHYGEELEKNLQDLSERLKRGAYRAKPVRRVYIPKADGRQRPLGVTALEDKIVQRAAVEVLNAIYETDFLGFSYGFRPGRSQHQALDALYAGLLTRRVNWVLDVDIRGFFDAIRPRMAGEVHRAPDCGPARRAAHPEMAERRRAGRWETLAGGGRNAAGRKCIAAAGESLSPLRFRLVGPRVAAEASARRVIVVRFADDIVLGFQVRCGCRAVLEGTGRTHGRSSRWNCTRTRPGFWSSAPSRLKTGSVAVSGKPETFDFLGFTHICGRTSKGQVHRAAADYPQTACKPSCRR